MDADAQTDEKISTMMSMGFPDIEAVTHALKTCAGDISEAVTMLTESNLGSYATKDDLSRVTDENVDKTATFPVSLACTLHNRVFSDSWNIPYKKNEALGQCIIAATRLAKEGLCITDSGCFRFLDELLPECFNKLTDTIAVRRWPSDVQVGILTMAELLIDLSITALQNESLPPIRGVLNALSFMFNYDNEYNSKNRLKVSEYRPPIIFAAPLKLGHSYGWLMDLLNSFGVKGGFQLLITKLKDDSLSFSDMAYLLGPFSVCACFLSKGNIWDDLKDPVAKLLDRLSNMNEGQLKSADAERCFQLVESCQQLCIAFWPKEEQRVTNLRFHLVYSMIKLPHFSARINALKGLGKLISDSDKGQSKLFDIDFVQNWMTEKRVLFYALDGR